MSRRRFTTRSAHGLTPAVEATVARANSEVTQGQDMNVEQAIKKWQESSDVQTIEFKNIDESDFVDIRPLTDSVVDESKFFYFLFIFFFFLLPSFLNRSFL